MKRDGHRRGHRCVCSVGMVWAVLRGKQVGAAYAEKVLCRDRWAGALADGATIENVGQGWWWATKWMAVLVRKKAGAWYMAVMMLLA
jgi:hypothetical protein